MSNGVMCANLSITYTYYPWTTANGQGRLKYLKTGTPSNSTSLQYMYYLYDAVGNVTQIRDYKAGGTQIQTFTYDELDRLKTASATGGTGGTYSTKTYSYNQIGNLTNSGYGTLTYGSSAHKHAVTAWNGNGTAGCTVTGAALGLLGKADFASHYPILRTCKLTLPFHMHTSVNERKIHSQSLGLMLYCEQ